jgi:hypothetical protein
MFDVDECESTFGEHTMIFRLSFFPSGKAICLAGGNCCGLIRVRQAISH